MSVIAEFSIPGEDFILGRALQETTGLSVELEKMVPTGDASIPYFWVIGENGGAFDAVLEREPELTSFEVIDELEDRRLYRAAWDHSADTFVQAIIEHDAILQEAGGDGESWSFQLRFPDSHQLSEFHTACREHSIDLTVDRLFNPIEPSSMTARGMTEAQRSLIERVYEEGYFEVPRRITLAEVADDLEVSDQAVNERLRRGLSTLIERTVMSDTDRDA